MRIFKVIFVAGSLAVAGLNGQTAGSVAGTVLEDGATPIAGATVSYRGSGHIQRGPSGGVSYLRPQVFGSVKSRSDGTFSILGLPPDRYTICAAGTLPIHISSCAWNTTDHRVSVTTGQNVTGLKLSVPRGALLAITIDDATGCAARYNKAPVFAFAGSLSAQAYPVSGTPGAYHYQVLVPKLVPLRIAANHRCSFTDSSSNALSGLGLSLPALQAESGSVTIIAK